MFNHFCRLQVKSGTIFDNILITDDEDFAAEVGDELWGETKEGEKKMKDEQDEEDKKRREEEGEDDEEEDFDMDDFDMDDMDMGMMDDEVGGIIRFHNLSLYSVHERGTKLWMVSMQYIEAFPLFFFKI